MSNDLIIRQEVADLRSHAEHESHQLASEAMTGAADTIENLLASLESLRNDVLSLTLQRDQALRDAERHRAALSGCVSDRIEFAAEAKQLREELSQERELHEACKLCVRELQGECERLHAGNGLSVEQAREMAELRQQLAASEATTEREREQVRRYKMMHHVAEDQLNDKLIQLQERDARYANDKRDADGDPASLCNICKGMIRYGERHSTCGAAFMEVEKQLATLTAERDDFRKTAHEFNAAITELQKRLQIRWQDLPGATTELVDAAPEGMRQLMRQWVDEFSQLRQQLAEQISRSEKFQQNWTDALSDNTKIRREMQQTLASVTADRDRMAASFSPRYDDDRSILSVIAHLRHGDSDGSDHDAAADEIERLAADRDRHRNENFAISQDDGKVERALESKQAECDRLTQQVAATTAAYDRINGRCLGFMDQVESIARFLDCGHCEIDIIAAVKSIRDERDVFTAALAEVRGESKEAEEIRSFVAHSRLLYEKHGYARALLSNQQIDTLLSVIDSLQLQEASSRNGFAQARVREQGLRDAFVLVSTQRIDEMRRAESAESRVRELERLCSTARDTLGYLADMHQLSPSDAMHVAELRSALASPPSPPTEHNPLDCEQCWLPHGDQKS